MPTIDERELEDYLMEDPENLLLIGVEVDPTTDITRQFRLGNYGIADIVCVTPTPGNVDFHFRADVIELKKGDLDVNALMQAARYRVGIQQHLKAAGSVQEIKIDYHVTLVGGSVSGGDWVYLGGLLQNTRVFTYTLNLTNGIEFDEDLLHLYKLTKPEFSKDFGNSLADWKRQYNDINKEYRESIGADSASVEPVKENG